MLFIARRHFVRRDHGQSRRGEGKNEKQRCEKAKILVPLVHSSPPVDLLYLLLFSVRAPPSYASPPRTILRTAQSAAVALEPLGDGKRILEPGIGKIVDDHLRDRHRRLFREAEAPARPALHAVDGLEALGTFPDGGEHGVSLSEAALHEKMRRWRTPTASSSQASWDGR